MQIEVLPILIDNYCYVLRGNGAQRVVVVDPGAGGSVKAYLDHEGLELGAILCTHHHADHVGGILELVKTWPKARVFGSAYDAEKSRIPGLTDAVIDEQRFDVEGLSVRALFTPGHTLGAMSYVVDEKHLFSGDTLFLAGCGRLFEGTAAMLHASLERLAQLAPSTLIYCGHEYTQTNLGFAFRVEPDNVDVRERLRALEQSTLEDQPSVPGSIAEELRTNPFLRVDETSVQNFVRNQTPQPSCDPVDVFAALRQARNSFR